MGIRYLQTTAGSGIPFIELTSGTVESLCPMDSNWSYNLTQLMNMTGLTQTQLGDWFGSASRPTFYEAFLLGGGGDSTVYVGNLGSITNHGALTTYTSTGMQYTADGFTVEDANGDTVVNGHGAILTTGIYYPNEASAAVSQYLCVGIVDSNNHVSFGCLQGCYGDVYGSFPSSSRAALITNYTLTIGEGKTAQDVYELFDDSSVWSDESEPTPTPAPKGGFDLSNRFDPLSAVEGTGIYKLSSTQVNELTDDLYNKTFMEGLKNLVGMAKDVPDAIIGLKWYYGIASSLTLSSDYKRLTIANKVFDGSDSSHAISAYAVTKSMIEFDCGSVTVNGFYGNYLDYESEYQIYLPFIGFTPLNANDIVGGTVSVRYNINLATGKALCYISVENARCEGVQIVIPTSVGKDIPINATQMANAELAGATAAIGAVAAGVAVATGAGAPIVAGIAGTTTGAVKGQISQNGQFARGGNLDGLTGDLGPLKPFILVNRPLRATPSGMENVIGARSCEVAQLSSKHGFVKASAIKPESISTSCKYIDEIIALVQSGVVMP